MKNDMVVAILLEFDDVSIFFQILNMIFLYVKILSLSLTSCLPSLKKK